MRNQLRHILVSVMVIFICNLGLSQDVHEFSIGDTFYRYSANLYNKFNKFSEIGLQYLDFSCAEEVVVKKPSHPNATLELHSDLRQDYRQISGVQMIATGGRMIDPFLGLTPIEINLKSPIPISRSANKDVLYHKTNDNFFVEFSTDELYGEIKIWAEKNEVTNIRVLCDVHWSTVYKRKDSFDNLEGIIQGFVVENILDFSVITLEVKKRDWVVYNFTSERVLSEAFIKKTIRYQSFYDNRSIAEVVRYYQSPTFAIEFNTKYKSEDLPLCSNGSQEIYLFPNPTFHNVKLRFLNAKPGNYTFNLINIIGKPIWTYSFNITKVHQEILLPMPSFSKGIYLYNIKNAFGKRMQSRRLTIVDP
ncbi:MAG: T9SS type A sorting domain-containing protein [Saprospiraceae bacterium]|nr:T9SS type A sorting domain-containing protein [Bacteroidia bacterium]NNL91114.1 T9SS type A sorting domain-containing protein [Saprospiraceae bacterium]